MNLLDHIRDHKERLLRVADESSFVVFLCGPALNNDEKPSSGLRARLKERLELEGFEVVLGEDEGLEDARLRLGINAQDNELEFIRRSCNAIIVIADSEGAYCELGLFSWHVVHKSGVIKNGTNADLIVLVDQKYENHTSYLNEGPVAAARGFGQVYFIDFESYTADEIVSRLRARRGVLTADF